MGAGRGSGDAALVPRGLDAAVAAQDLSGGSLVVAVSGGMDSSVLAHALAAAAGRHRLTLAIGHVNHGLRGAGSDGDERAVRDLADALGLPVEVARVDPEALRAGASSRDRPTLQEAARTLRYAALLEMADRIDRMAGTTVATAHHADDQVETVLLRLLRGCGPDGLGGIPERAHGGRVVRPLLSVSRAAIAAYARTHGLRWREDPSNRDPRFARNRLRRDWLPGLTEAFNPQLLRAIGNLAEAQRREAEWLDSIVEQEACGRLVPDGDALRIAGSDWGELPAALARRLLRRALVSMGGARHVSRVHIDRTLDFLAEGASGRTGARLELPGGLRMEREAGSCRLRRVGSRLAGSEGSERPA